MNEPDHKDIQKLLEKELTHIGAYRRLATEHYMRFEKPSRHLFTYNNNKPYYFFKIGAQSYSNQQGDAQIKSLITQLGNEIIALHERKKQ